PSRLCRRSCSWRSAPIGLDEGRRFPRQVESLTKELPDDGKGRQADEGFGTRGQSASPFKAPEIDLHGERLKLAASDRLVGGVLTNRNGIGGTWSPSGGKRSLA